VSQPIYSARSSVETSFQFEETEIRRLPFAVPVSIGMPIVLDGEDKDLRVIDISLNIDDAPTLVVEVGEQRGPGLTPS
jgi:hypothetical protein